MCLAQRARFIIGQDVVGTSVAGPGKTLWGLELHRGLTGKLLLDLVEGWRNNHSIHTEWQAAEIITNRPSTGGANPSRFSTLRSSEFRVITESTLSQH